MPEQYFIRGTFQPLDRAAIESARKVLSARNRKLTVYVQISPRGPEAPFSFEQVKEMWKRAFLGETEIGILQVVPSGGPVPLGIEVVPERNEERHLRDQLSETAHKSSFWNTKGLHSSVVRAIDSFEDDWREYLNGHSADLLSQPVGPE